MSGQEKGKAKRHHDGRPIEQGGEFEALGRPYACRGEDHLTASPELLPSKPTRVVPGMNDAPRRRAMRDMRQVFMVTPVQL